MLRGCFPLGSAPRGFFGKQGTVVGYDGGSAMLLCFLTSGSVTALLMWLAQLYELGLSP